MFSSASPRARHPATSLPSPLEITMRSNTSTLLRAGVITPLALAAALAFAGTANAAVSVA